MKADVTPSPYNQNVKESCPTCDSQTGLREILYGMPAEPVDESKYFVSGCCVSPNQPIWACIDCGWRGWSLNNLSGTKLGQIRCPICRSRGKMCLIAMSEESNYRARNHTYRVEIPYDDIRPNAMCLKCGWTCLLQRTYSY